MDILIAKIYLQSILSSSSTLDTVCRCKTVTGGTPAQYIPQLAKADVSKWGVSVCSVDGQRFNIGDTKTPVSADNQQ